MKIRPPLTDANKDTWHSSFVSLWEQSRWVLIGDPENLPEPAPSRVLVRHPREDDLCKDVDLLALDAYAFSYSGPCGIATHLIYAGWCAKCTTVFWLTGPMLNEFWTPSHLEKLKTAQDSNA